MALEKIILPSEITESRRASFSSSVPCNAKMTNNYERILLDLHCKEGLELNSWSDRGLTQGAELGVVEGSGMGWNSPMFWMEISRPSL